MVCKHEFWERESSVATEGFCPLCMSSKIQWLEGENARLQCDLDAMEMKRNRAAVSCMRYIEEIERLEAEIKILENLHGLKEIAPPDRA